MKVRLAILALVTATVNLFGDFQAPYRCDMTGNTLEADIILFLTKNGIIFPGN